MDAEAAKLVSRPAARAYTAIQRRMVRSPENQVVHDAVGGATRRRARGASV